MAQITKKLLVVDDEPDIRASLSLILTGLGHEVRCAEEGFSALEQIREIQPDIILSDLNMPGMSGFELLSVVRRRLPSIYVIATSGAYSGEDVPPGIAADAFYEKASGFRTLLHLLSSAVASAETPSRAGSESPTIWVSQSENNPEEPSTLVLNCPQCLRNSSQLLVDSLREIHQTKCLYCDALIHYAVIRPMDAVASQTNQPGLGPLTLKPEIVTSSRFVASGGLIVES